jgi:hypothetical protein
MSRIPKTIAELEKIAQVKKHYASVLDGSTPCFGAGNVIKSSPKRRSPSPPPPPQESVKPVNSKQWTVVNNQVRKSKWKRYFDPEDLPQNYLVEETSAWADYE